MWRPYRAVKPLLDAALTAVLLLLAAPLMAAIALAVRVRLGRPILFRQVRPGLHREPFVMYKFRTMTEERDASGHLRPDAERLTPFGRLLRSSSLDELPELFNVLKGEMSLVGPRPLLVEYLDRYSVDEARRHEVKPGITGWAQVNGRNAAPWPERLERDVFYVDHMSFWLDVRILALTAIQVWKREGITAAGHATMPAFAGREAPPTRAGSSAADGDR